jgi:thiamine kinase-like enzyme
VWEWVAGKPLTAEYAREHGRILRVLHEQTPMPAGELLVITDQLESAKLRLEAAPASGDKKGLLVLLDRVEALLAACNEGDIVPSHGDAHDANILLTEEGLVLLDFDTAGPAPRLIDVASGVYSWGLRHNDAAAAREFIDGYGMHELVTDEALRTLVWVRRFRAACTRLSWGESLSARLPELLEGPKAYW